MPFCKACRLREDKQREQVQALEEEELLRPVRKVVRNVYKHVRDTGRRLGDGAYLPRIGQEKSEFYQLRYLRRLHRWGELTDQEYTLLERQPHIVGRFAHRCSKKWKKCCEPGCEHEAASHIAKFCRACCRNRRFCVRGLHKKKDLAALLQDFQAHAQWAVSNLHLLRSRSGRGFKEKLRPSLSAEEKRIYNWFYRHPCDWELGSLLAQQLAIVDAFVTKSEAALLQEYRLHAALARLLATCTLEGSKEKDLQLVLISCLRLGAGSFVGATSGHCGRLCDKERGS